MRVEASKVVPGGVQLGSLDKLQGQQSGESGLHPLPPNPTPISLLSFCADLFYVSPVPKCYHTPCECPVVRDALSGDP